MRRPPARRARASAACARYPVSQAACRGHELTSVRLPRAFASSQDEDTINTQSEQARLKEIPVPKSLAQTRAEGTNTFTLPPEHIRAPPPREQWQKSTGVFEDDERVDWDIDPHGFRFLKKLNNGESSYTGPKIEEAVFEKLIDRFEKSVKADVMPELAALRTKLAPLVADPAVIDVSYEYYLQRRKQLAMPLVRLFRPAPSWHGPSGSMLPQKCWVRALCLGRPTQPENGRSGES